MYPACCNDSHPRPLFPDFSRRKAALLLNAELADTLGNLLGRCSGAAVNPEQRRRPVSSLSRAEPDTQRLLEATARLPAVVGEAFEEFCFYRGLEELQAVLRSTNQVRNMGRGLSRVCDRFRTHAVVNVSFPRPVFRSSLSGMSGMRDWGWVGSDASLLTDAV